MKILLSAPRAGSSYVYENIEKYNLSLPNVKKIGPEEYLDPNQLPFLTLKEKIDILEEARLIGIEYTFKHHINYLKKDYDYYENWFKDFYKDYEILVLKRKDTWKWFLSFLFQDFVGWKLASFTDEKSIKNIDINSLFINYDYKTTLAQFFKIKSQLDLCIGTVIYYEDLVYNDTKNKKLSTYIKYESFFDNINIIKEEFNKYD